MIQAGGLDSNQRLAYSQRRQLLDSDLDHLGAAGAERAGNTALSRLIQNTRTTV